MSTIGFLAVPETTAEAQRLFDDDIADLGYVLPDAGIRDTVPTAVLDAVTFGRPIEGER